MKYLGSDAYYANETRKKYDSLARRLQCPSSNAGRIFGIVGDAMLEGSVMNPDYCIVQRNGECTRHKGKGE